MPISPPPGRPMLFARGIIPAIAGSLLAIAAPVYAQQESQQNSQQSGQRDDDESETATTSTQFTPLDITQTTRSSSERDVTAEGSSGSGTDKINRATSSNDAKRPEPKLSEFEQFLASMAGRKVSRFGADLLVPSATDYSVPSALVIPPDYPIGVGDVIAINLTGSVVGSAEFPVDANGRIFLPNIGEVSLIGVRYRDLKRHVSQAIGAQYRGYDVSVSIKKLHGIRVFVTGFAQQPGVYTVNSLSTLLGALIAAGGPNAGGSLRSVKLYRNGQEVQDFDLYDILRKGDRSRDPILRNEDVLFVPPVGKQVAVIGSANEEAIYELRGQETLEDLLAYAGGPNQLADPDRVILYRLADRDSIGSRELPRAQLALSPAEGGDVLQILAKGSLARPIEKQSVLVRLEGEVQRPGNYFVAPGTSVGEVVRLAGGFTSRAFVYGTVFSRATVREQQRESFRAAVEQLEQMVNAAALTGYASQSQPDREAQLASARALLQRMRSAEPDGRLVMDIAPTATALPETVVLENNDRIIVPPRVDTVGVFGAVYRPASFLLEPALTGKVKDYLESAGGVQRSADKGAIFVVHANGAVETKRRGALNATALPGDVLFVPVRTQSSTLLAKIKDITQIIFQAGIGAAALAAIK
ncbi:capsule polysaccharide export system periplasmic protein KpsD [Novosphingobium subterraneum]|uniref:Capsule polysaccharide export system periplasmic protein KpsD n=1 Tax=Novosphingobium subterraneum TaxID=48936 RepID=A0A0B9A0A8_9SPHN|nr:capsule polysaccharide export system periplasmic protein KpsD [Novosphingobium subterraneum]